MKFVTWALALVLMLAAAVGPGPTAAAQDTQADCPKPTFRYEADEYRTDDEFTIVGNNWMDTCVGSPRTPISRIRITLTQGDVEVAVARGNADARGRFEVTFPIPDELGQGAFEILVKAPGVSGTNATREEVTVLRQRDIPADTRLVRFGPDEPLGPIEFDDEAAPADDDSLVDGATVPIDSIDSETEDETSSVPAVPVDDETAETEADELAAAPLAVSGSDNSWVLLAVAGVLGLFGLALFGYIVKKYVLVSEN